MEISRTSASLAGLPDDVLMTVCRDSMRASHCLLTNPGLAVAAEKLDSDPAIWLQILKKFPELTGFAVMRHCLDAGHWQELCDNIPAMYFRLLPDSVVLPQSETDSPPVQLSEPAVVNQEFIPAMQAQWTQHWCSMSGSGYCAGFALDFAAFTLSGFHPMEYARQFFPAQLEFRQTSTRDRIMHFQKMQSKYRGTSYPFPIDKRTGEGVAELVVKLFELLPERKVLLIEGMSHGFAIAMDQSGSIICFANNIGFYQFKDGDTALTRDRLEALILERLAVVDKGKMMFMITEANHRELLKPAIRGRKQQPTK